MSVLPFCACGCGRRVPAEHALSGWRMDCATMLLDDWRRLQNMRHDDFGMLVAFLRDRGFDRMANKAVGCLPFEVQA